MKMLHLHIQENGKKYGTLTVYEPRWFNLLTKYKLNKLYKTSVKNEVEEMFKKELEWYKKGIEWDKKVKP